MIASTSSASTRAGTGESEDAIDCRVNQETTGVYRQPFPTPENLDIPAWIDVSRRYVNHCVRLNDWDDLAYATTANAARDMNFLRAAVGDRKLSYLGFSYGTAIGATYASLFPNRERALVLDGAFDLDKYLNKPLLSLREQSSGFEKGLNVSSRPARRTRPPAWASADAIPGSRSTSWSTRSTPTRGRPRPRTRLVDGDDVLAAANLNIYAKQAWPFLAGDLAAAQAGDLSLIRQEVDFF